MSRGAIKIIRNYWGLLLLLGFNNCKNQDKVVAIGEFEYPDRAWLIIGDSTKIMESAMITFPALCFWLDSTKCTPCEYDMLYNFDPYYKVEQGINFFVIISPSTSHQRLIDFKMSVDDFSFPVIVDMDCSFYDKQVPVVNSDTFAYLYIDENGMGYKYLIPDTHLTYDMGKVFRHCETNHR